MRNVSKILIGIFIMLLLFGCANSEETSELFTTNENVSIPQLSQQQLIINLTPHQYTYEDLVYDIAELRKICEDTICVYELCSTADGRKVYDIVLGDLDCENQILIFGAIHGREYITSQIVMKQLCDSIDCLNGYGGEYNGILLAELFEKITIHFIPMSNPDGVTISQFGLSKINNADIKSFLLSMGSNDYEQWKSNANGIDLNRNFDAGWDEYVGSLKPSSEKYKGTAPGSEPESNALIELTKKYNIKRTVSYHTCGAQIYWYYKQTGNVLKESADYAECISAETGYPLDSDYTAVDAAGYKDWAVYSMGIPSITIEIGNESGRGIINPVPIDYFSDIWSKNKKVVYATIYNLKYPK